MNISELGETRLRRDALSLSHIVASTLASIAPAMSFFFGFAVIVQGAGLAAPLTILTAMIVILFRTNTIAQFSRFLPSAGSFVTFCGKSFGPSVGAAVAVFLIFGYLVAEIGFVIFDGAEVFARRDQHRILDRIENDLGVNTLFFTQDFNRLINVFHNFASGVNKRSR